VRFIGGQGPTSLRYSLRAAACLLMALTAASCEGGIVSTGPPALLDITLSGDGSGSVVSAPRGIDCGTNCVGLFIHGTDVTLTANPAAGSDFLGWTGSCTGLAPCTLNMTAARQVTATFVRR
jgi:endoglucanase